MKWTYLAVLLPFIAIHNCSGSEKKPSQNAPDPEQKVADFPEVSEESCRSVETMVVLLDGNDQDRASILNMMVEHRSKWAQLTKQEIQNVWSCYIKRSDKK